MHYYKIRKMILDTIDNYQLLRKRNSQTDKYSDKNQLDCTKGCMPDAEGISLREEYIPTHLTEK